MKQDAGARNDTKTAKHHAGGGEQENGSDDESDDEFCSLRDEEMGLQLEPGIPMTELDRESDNTARHNKNTPKGMASSNSGTRDEEEDLVSEIGDEEPGRQLEPGVDIEQLEDKEHFLLDAEEPKSRFERALRHMSILMLLSFSAIWGLLTREGIVALNTYPGMSIDPTIWAQAVGCFVMGWTVGHRKVLEVW